MHRLVLSCLIAAGICAAAGPTPGKTALDKPTLEAYVRHLFVWGPQIKIEIGEPSPAPMPGFLTVNVHASSGNASKDVPLYVSKDGQKVIQGTVYDVNQNPFKADLEKLKTQNHPSFGTPGATVVLVEFSDFECAFCKEEAMMLRTNLLSAYPKQVRVYFEDFPLEQLHPWARAAAVAGRCIFRQNPNAFWDYHDWIFAQQNDITVDNLKQRVLEFAKGKQIDTLQLTRCMDAKATESEVNESIALGKALGIDSTPTVFVNGRRMVGRSDWNTLKQVIDNEIEYQKTARNAGEDCGCELKIPMPGAK